MRKGSFSNPVTGECKSPGWSGEFLSCAGGNPYSIDITGFEGEPAKRGGSMALSNGSVWRKWDLHVHTPMSIVQHYGGDTPEVWEKYVLALENLPPEIQVLGVNDYIFIDGYRKLLQFKKNGRMANIARLFPVIELRLNKFGGSESKLSRVNFHVLFSDEVSCDIIQAQFINTLTTAYVIADNLHWSAVPTIGSLANLGQMVKHSAPKDVEVGFNALNFSKEGVMRRLQQHYFQGHVLTAVGSTEWDDIRWNQQSSAEKRDMINSVDMVFTASPTAEQFAKTRLNLERAEVNHMVIHASDAHYFADSVELSRLGHCYTWIKADTTFDGLKQALKEPNDRIWIGEEKPPKLMMVQNNSTHYVQSLKVKAAASLPQGRGIWFDAEIVFNPELISIVGNKGHGKSALADILGLLGNSPDMKYCSFLNEKKFRKNKLANQYAAELFWESGERISCNLGKESDSSSVPTIKYLPQHYLEVLCNDEDIYWNGNCMPWLMPIFR